MRRKWQEALDALERLKQDGFIDSYFKPSKVASVTIYAPIELGPYSLAEVYAWIDGCEAMGAAAWPTPARVTVDR